MRLPSSQNHVKWALLAVKDHFFKVGPRIFLWNDCSCCVWVGRGRSAVSFSGDYWMERISLKTQVQVSLLTVWVMESCLYSLQYHQHLRKNWTCISQSHSLMGWWGESQLFIWEAALPRCLPQTTSRWTWIKRRDPWPTCAAWYRAKAWSHGWGLFML